MCDAPVEAKTLVLLPDHVPGLNFVSMERELSRLLHGRWVDLVTPKFLNVHIREQVLRASAA
jgi:predicted nucleotidyltransferase